MSNKEEAKEQLDDKFLKFMPDLRMKANFSGELESELLEDIKEFIDSTIDKNSEDVKQQTINDVIEIIASSEGFEGSADYYKKLVKEKLS